MVPQVPSWDLAPSGALSSSPGLTPSGQGRAPGRPPPRTPEESARRLAGAGRGAAPPPLPTEATHSTGAPEGGERARGAGQLVAGPGALRPGSDP